MLFRLFIIVLLAGFNTYAYNEDRVMAKIMSNSFSRY